MEREYFVYTLTYKRNTVLYTGVTNDIVRRMREHLSGLHLRSFTNRYRTTKLVYVESFQYIWDAIRWEKMIKAGPRRRKVQLIESMNPQWGSVTTSAIPELTAGELTYQNRQITRRSAQFLSSTIPSIG